MDLYTIEVKQEIMKVFHGMKWVSIDIVRIGWEDHEILPVVLWVSVEPGTTKWEVAHSRALHAVRTLQECGIFNIECEVREASFYAQVDSAVAPRFHKIQEVTSDDMLQAFPLELDVQNLGHSISSSHLERHGTMGLILKLKYRGSYSHVVLTCRHVVLDDARDGVETYKDTEVAAADKIKIAQPGHKVVKQLREWTENRLRIINENEALGGDGRKALLEKQKQGELHEERDQRLLKSLDEAAYCV